MTETEINELEAVREFNRTRLSDAAWAETEHSARECITHHHACDCRERAFRELISEVMLWHSDPESADYNECDKTPCMWCENARKLLCNV